jgi:uncharacterized membrane protein YdjX (TVP38/TMEM64 family)
LAVGSGSSGFEGLLERLGERLLSVNPAVAAFVISLVSNAIPFMTVPYLFIIAQYGALMDNAYAKIVVSVAGGLGAAVGKLIVFYMGQGVHRMLSEEKREDLEFFVQMFRRSVFLAVFLFAALPLPDDLLYIPLGVAGYSPLLFFAAVALGKVFLTTVAVVFGDAVGRLGRYLSSLLGVKEGTATYGLTTTILLVALGLLATYIVIRMNWKKIVYAYNEYGPVIGTLELLIQFFIALLPRRLGARLEQKADEVLARLAGGEQRQQE